MKIIETADNEQLLVIDKLEQVLTAVRALELCAGRIGQQSKDEQLTHPEATLNADEQKIKKSFDILITMMMDGAVTAVSANGGLEFDPEETIIVLEAVETLAEETPATLQPREQQLFAGFIPSAVYAMSTLEQVAVHT